MATVAKYVSSAGLIAGMLLTVLLLLTVYGLLNLSVLGVRYVLVKSANAIAWLRKGLGAE